MLNIKYDKQVLTNSYNFNQFAFVLHCKFYQLQWLTNNNFGNNHLEDLRCMVQSSPVLGTSFVLFADIITAAQPEWPQQKR